MDLSTRHGEELWTLGGRCFEGVLLIKRGDVDAGLELPIGAPSNQRRAEVQNDYTVALAGEYEFSDPEIANRLLVNLGKGELVSYYRPIPPARWLVIGVV